MNKCTYRWSRAGKGGGVGDKKDLSGAGSDKKRAPSHSG